MLSIILIDDEADALENLELILKDNFTDIRITGKTTSPKEGISLIMQNNPDVVLLDIDMPFMDGFELLESIPDRNFDVIFITAYNEYAIKAFKVSAVDYILKPVKIKELIAAINKIRQKKSRVKGGDRRYNLLLENVKSDAPLKLAIPTLEGLEYIMIKDIIRIEAEGSYSTIIFKDRKKMVVSKGLNELAEMLAGNDNFIRIHRSHLINVIFVKKYMRKDGHIMLEDDAVVRLAPAKKDVFVKGMERFVGRG